MFMKCICHGENRQEKCLQYNNYRTHTNLISGTVECVKVKHDRRLASQS